MLYQRLQIGANLLEFTNPGVSDPDPALVLTWNSVVEMLPGSPWQHFYHALPNKYKCRVEGPSLQEFNSERHFARAAPMRMLPFVCDP